MPVGQGKFRLRAAPKGMTLAGWASSRWRHERAPNPSRSPEHSSNNPHTRDNFHVTTWGPNLVGLWGSLVSIQTQLPVTFSLPHGSPDQWQGRGGSKAVSLGTRDQPPYGAPPVGTWLVPGWLGLAENKRQPPGALGLGLGYRLVTTEVHVSPSGANWSRDLKIGGEA